MLQQCIESFVYSVLGAQARTRWSIVESGARSLQTQDVFRKLVRDTILEDDVTKSVSNMRKAIQDTNVVLNMAVSPGIILVPSDMIIIKEKTPGWNNILTLATDKMIFGTNKEVNSKDPVKYSGKQPATNQQSTGKQPATNQQSTGKQPATKQQSTGKQQVVTTPKFSNNTFNLVITGVVVSLVTKVIILMI